MSPVPSPYGNHVCLVTVIAATAQVEEGCDVVRGHGSAHIPRDHSDPGGANTGGVTAGRPSLTLVSFPQGPFSGNKLRQVWVQTLRRTTVGPVSRLPGSPRGGQLS